MAGRRHTDEMILDTCHPSRRGNNQSRSGCAAAAKNQVDAAVGFARTTEATMAQSATEMNAVRTETIEIQRIDRDLVAEQSKVGEVDLATLVATTMNTLEFHNHTAIDSQSLVVKIKVADSATSPFGHDAGAQKCSSFLPHSVLSSGLVDARNAPIAAGADEWYISGCLGIAETVMERLAHFVILTIAGALDINRNPHGHSN